MKKKTTATKKSTKVFDYRTIKSFEDACKKEGIDPLKLPDVSMIPEDLRSAVINYYKLCIIYRAINNGWTPDWSDWNQYKYYPWLMVLSSGSGFGFSDTLYLSARTGTGVGSRLCTDNSEKAMYIGNTFGKEYAEFFLIRK